MHNEFARCAFANGLIVLVVYRNQLTNILVQISQEDILDASTASQDDSSTLRAIFCHIKNQTRFTLEPLESYLLSGTEYRTGPRKVAPFQYNTAITATNKASTDKEIGGGTYYMLVLDSKYQMNVSLVSSFLWCSVLHGKPNLN